MKLREYFYMLGFKPKTRSYGYEEREQQLEGQTVRYAQWMHPKAYPVAVQQKELQRIRQYLQPGDVAIDIGAHAGDTMLPMALAAGKTGAVVCFEANPLVFPTLDYNAGANPDLTTIHAHNVAITETEGPFEFSSNDPGFNNGGTTSRTNKFRRGDVFRMEVPGVRLDGFMQQHHPELVDKLRFIKIDTEGYDLYILRAIADLLQRTRPVVQAEVLHLTPQEYRLDMLNFFRDNGYVPTHMRSSGAAPLKVMEDEDTISKTNFDIIGIPEERLAAARNAA